MNRLSIAAVALGGLAAVSPSPAQSWTAAAAPNTNWSCVACSADGSVTVAGTDYGPFYFSRDSGATWTTAGMPNGHGPRLPPRQMAPDWWRRTRGTASFTPSDDSGSSWRTNNVPNEYWTSVACSADGSRLVAAYVTLNGAPGGIYGSSDSGKTWAPTGAPPRYWRSVASSADGARLVAAENGYDGAALTSTIWISTDCGATFQVALTNAQNWRCVASSADGTKLAAASGWGSGTVFTSTNSGVT